MTPTPSQLANHPGRNSNLHTDTSDCFVTTDIGRLTQLPTPRITSAGSDPEMRRHRYPGRGRTGPA